MKQCFRMALETTKFVKVAKSDGERSLYASKLSKNSLKIAQIATKTIKIARKVSIWHRESPKCFEMARKIVEKGWQCCENGWKPQEGKKSLKIVKNAWKFYWKPLEGFKLQREGSDGSGTDNNALKLPPETTWSSKKSIHSVLLP